VNRRAYAALLVGGALVAQAGLASPAFAAAVRYAAPGGSGTACSAAAPCSIETAINSAATGDEVVVGSGTYTTAVSLKSTVSNLTIHGAAGQPRPVINSSAGRAIDLGNSTGTSTTITVSDLTIVHTGGEYGLNVFAKSTLVQRVSVTTTATTSSSTTPTACSPGISGMLRDSLCVTTAANGIAVDDSWSADTGALNLRNVTAIATGPGSYGVRGDASGPNTTLTIDARNVIASGVAADVRATQTGSRSTSAVTMRTSNYDTTQVLGGATVLAPGNTNQTAAPVFLDTTTYRQAKGSPTIDKGAVYSDNGVADLQGEPRVTGSAPDIGVDELDVTPPDTRFSHTPKRKVHKRKATFVFAATEHVAFTCKVDKKKAAPCASPLKVKVKRYGKHKLTVTATDDLGNVDATPATYEWKYKHKKHKKKKHHHHH
jgi:hypothetical protein